MEVKRDPEGKIENKSGGHDDKFMALGIALALSEDPWQAWTPRKRPEEKKKPNPLITGLGFPRHHATR